MRKQIHGSPEPVNAKTNTKENHMQIHREEKRNENTKKYKYKKGIYMHQNTDEETDTWQR